MFGVRCMRKFVFIVSMVIGIILVQISAANNAYAEKVPEEKKTRIAVVIIANDPAFKLEYYAKSAKKSFEKAVNNKKNIFDSAIRDITGEYAKNKKVTVMASDVILNQFQNYLDDKEIDENDRTNKSTFIDFVTYGNYDKVIYLVVDDPVIDTNGDASTAAGSTVVIKSRISYDTSLTVNGFLVDREKVLTRFSATRNWTGNRGAAKYGAFDECVRSISKEFNPML